MSKEQYIHCNLLVSDPRPADRQPYDSPESDSGDYVPPDASESDHHLSEDSNSNNKNEPQRHVHKHQHSVLRMMNMMWVS